MITIAAKILYETDFNRDSMLVVITDREDSAPRGIGSIMLAGAFGRIQGTIGGGAVEKMSEEMAKNLLAEKRSAVHVFHLNPNNIEDIGMVCGGDVTVLFQYISGTDAKWRAAMETIVSRYHSRENGWLVLDLNGGAPAVTDIHGHVVCGEAADLDVPDGKNCEVSDGHFFMYFNTGERAILFGAGHCGKALAPILDSVGFRVVMFDNRAEFTDPSMYPYADQVICGDYNNISDSIELDSDDYIVVMTSGHVFDAAVERQALAGERAYVGVIGSAKKTASVNKRLIAEGIPEEKLREVYTPIGLPIKAVTPEEIAVSIAGEMIRVRANRRAGIEEHPPANKTVH